MNRPPLRPANTDNNTTQRGRRNATVRALVIVNCQNDFFEGGATPVPHAKRVIEHINTHLRPRKFDLVILTKQMRSSNDTTFCSNNPGTKPYEVEHFTRHGAQKMLPDHCVRGTVGCRLRPTLVVDPCDIIVETCTNPHPSESSGRTAAATATASALSKRRLQVGGVSRRPEVNLGTILSGERVTDVFLCGVPTEFIALDTVRSIRSAMKNVRIYHISDASRPIQPSSASARTAHDQMKRQRVIDIQSTGAEIDRIALRRKIPVEPPSMTVDVGGGEGEGGDGEGGSGGGATTTTTTMVRKDDTTLTAERDEYYHHFVEEYDDDFGLVDLIFERRKEQRQHPRSMFPPLPSLRLLKQFGVGNARQLHEQHEPTGMNSVREACMVHVGGTRCAPSSPDNTMHMHGARWTVGCIRACIVYIFMFCCVHTRGGSILTLLSIVVFRYTPAAPVGTR